ncbi:MAG: ATPase [Treponema sp.]|nr:ATPase [Treponema sp.]
MFKKIFAILGLLLVFSTAVVFAQESSSTGNADDVTLSVQEDSAEGLSKTAKYIAAAIAVAVACLAGGLAVGKIGAAAMGAMSENPEVSGKALPFVGLAEGICLWGMLVAVLILIL